MFKNFVYNKTFKMVSLLMILAIILTFPTSTKYELNSNGKSIKNNVEVYLLNNNNYIAKTNLTLNNYEKIENIIELLIIEGKYSDLIPNKYKAILPSETKILDIEEKEDILIINFNNKFLESSSENVEKYISLIVHNCLNNTNFNKLYIEVESKLLTNHNNTIFEQPFTKSYPVNMINKSKDYKNIKRTEVFFYSSNNDMVPITILNNSNKKKVDIIIDELSNSNYKDLYSYMNYNVNLIDSKIENEDMLLFFDDSIYDNNLNKVVLKPVYDLLEASIISNFPVKNIKIYVNNKEIKKSDIKNVE